MHDPYHCPVFWPVIALVEYNFHMELLFSETGVKPLLIEHALHWRYATKVFDKHKKIPEEKLHLLLEALRLSPSSMGLQPWKFVLVNKKAFRSELKKNSMHQVQLTDASHLIILCSLKKIDSDYIERLINLEKSDRQHSYLENYKAVVLSFLESKTKEELRQWMAEQVYIALGFLLTTCALLQIDACPIEAFDHAKYNKILGLAKHGIETRVAVALGHRGNDPHAVEKKTRWPLEEVLITV